MYTRYQVKCWDYICEPTDQTLSSRAYSLANQTDLHSKQKGLHVILCDTALMWPSNRTGWRDVPSLWRT